ncbi:MAG: MFS transporter, partial [Promethearchaeota archaeon]
GRNFGILRALDNLGAVVGIMITITFVTFVLPYLNSLYGFTDLVSIRVLFMTAAIPSIIGATLIFLRIKDYRKKPGKPVFSLEGFNRSLALFIGISFIFSVAFFSYSFIVLYASLFFTIPVLNPLLEVTIGYLIFTLAAALLSAPLGKLSDHIGRRGALLVGYGCFALMCLLFLLLPSTWVIALICYGATIGAAVPVQKSLVAELAPTELRASFLGVYQLVTGFAAFFASVLAGLLWFLFSPQTPFIVSLGLTVVAALLLPFVKERKEVI